MPLPAKSVAVIGAGPAGAIATDALVKEQAFDRIRVFERRSAIGGTWVYTPHLPAGIPSVRELLSGGADSPVPVPAAGSFPTTTAKSARVNGHRARFSDTAQHEHLHSNITPEIMAFSGAPFPETLSARLLAEHGPGAPFRHREVIRDWVEQLFVRGGHRGLVQLDTTVERAEKTSEGRWVLTLRRERAQDNYWWQEEFDALVVAAGHYNVPWLPPIDGLAEYDERWPGRIVHSKHFRGAERFKGKKVVVVGGSVSSSELLHEILPVAQRPVFGSLRGAPIPAFGLIPWTHPHVVVKEEIVRLDPETGDVHFADGSVLGDVDHVVFGTGYTFSLPFLPERQARIGREYRRLPGVWQHTWDIEDPSLTFVGMLGGGFTFRVYEYQAVAVARFLCGRASPLPPAEEQRDWERKRVAELGGGKNYYSIAPDYGAFFELLRQIAREPTPGTTGRVLAPFDKRLLDVWAGMVRPKIEAWERTRKRAEEELQVEKGGQVKARL